MWLTNMVGSGDGNDRDGTIVVILSKEWALLRNGIIA